MTKTALASAIAYRHGLTQAEAIRVVNTMTDMIGHLLEEHGRLSLNGFGLFSLRERPARCARNPRTGAQVNVPARRTVAFTPARALKARIARPGGA